jgi:hypothetical protein
MLRRMRSRGRCLTVLVALAGFAPSAVAVPVFDYETPVFGLAASGNSLYVADAGAGIVRLRTETGKLFTELPGVTDAVPRPTVACGR